MSPAKPILTKNGVRFFGAAFGVALLLTAAAANAQQMREQGFHFPGFGPPPRAPQRIDNSDQLRAHSRAASMPRSMPALDPEIAATDMGKPDRPRPKGSDARICANQEKDLAVYRIRSCGVIIASGKLRGEALGVAYELRGLAFLDRDDVAHAIGDLNRAVDLAPEFAPAYQNRGNAWYARGNFGQAIADYDKAIALDPNSASPYINRAAVRRDLGYREGALEDYARAIELRPTHAPTYSGRGQLYLANKDYARATADFDRAIQYGPSADNYMLRAAAREGAGDPDGAIGSYQQAAKLDPKNVAPLNAMASALFQKKDYDAEIGVLTRAVPLDEKPALSYRLRAEAWLAKGERKKAYADIAHALKYAWSVNGLRVRGLIRLDDGDAKGALADAESMLKIENNNTDAFALRGLAYARKKDYAKALPDLNKAIEADASNALAFAGRAQIYLAKNDSAHALPDLSRAIDLHVASAAPYRTRAAIYSSNGDIAKALADLTQAIALDPKPAEPYVTRAALRQTKGDMAGALTDYDAALTRDPNDAKLYYLRGQTRERTGDSEKAAADYKLALTHDKKLNEARKALAAIEQRRITEAENKKLGVKAAKSAKTAKLAKPEPSEAAVAPVAQNQPASKSEAAPEVTGTIPKPAAKPTNMPVTMPANQVKHETARERAMREAKERRDAARKTHEARQRAQAPRHELRELTPSEQRRLYFQALEQKARAEKRRSGREARFTDAFR